jgi:hypothetical protein
MHAMSRCTYYAVQVVMCSKLMPADGQHLPRPHLKPPARCCMLKARITQHQPGPTVKSSANTGEAKPTLGPNGEILSKLLLLKRGWQPRSAPSAVMPVRRRQAAHTAGLLRPTSSPPDRLTCDGSVMPPFLMTIIPTWRVSAVGMHGSTSVFVLCLRLQGSKKNQNQENELLHKIFISQQRFAKLCRVCSLDGCMARLTLSLTHFMPGDAVL